MVEPKDVESGVGKQVFVPCSADGLPKPTVEWIKVNGEDGETFIGPELRFSGIGQNDSGFYECRAKNGLEKDLVSRIKVNVLGK